MKYVLLVTCLYFFVSADCQSTKLKLEGFAAPGLFVEHLSSDSLIPPHRKTGNRLGDVGTFAIQAIFPSKNERWLIKAGIGFSQRHYSLNKYSIDDFFIAIFSFDSPPRRDSFNLSYIRYTNNYFQVPLSFAYTLKKTDRILRVSAGINLRADFLLNSKVQLRFDSSYKIPNQQDFDDAKNFYSANNSKFVFTAEPYIQTSFYINKNVGLYTQFRPISFYSSRLNKQLTTSSKELFGFTFGFFYGLK